MAITSVPLPTGAPHAMDNGTPYTSYAVALTACASTPTNLHSSLLAKCDLCAKQVLINKAPNAQSHDIVRSPEADILAKVNEAIKKLSITDPPHPHPLAVGVKKLPSRAFFLEMNSETSAELLVNPTLTSDFIRNFDTTSTIKPNNYLIIAEFVPTF